MPSPANAPQVGIPLDPSFFRRVYLASVVLASLFGLFASARLGAQWGLGFLLFALWSTLNLWSLERLLRLVASRQDRRPGRIVAALLFKLCVVYGLGALLILRGGFDGYALMAGFSVPLLVIVLKVLGRVLAGRTALHQTSLLVALLCLGNAAAADPAPLAAHADTTHGAAVLDSTAHDAHADPHATNAHGEAAHHGHHLELPHLLMIAKEWVFEEGTPAYRWVSMFENTFFAFLAGLLVTIAAVLVYRRRQELPGRLQALFEIVLEMIEGLASSMMGPKYGRHYTPFIATIFVYLLAMNYSGLIPFGKAPTSTFLNNASIAICVFLYVQYTGIRRNGLGGYLHHLAGSPKDVVGWALSPLLFALELFGEFVKPVSLSLRLFGNIFGEDMLLAVFALLGVVVMSGIGVPVGIPFHLPFLFLSLLLGLIQALVFSLLTTVYLSLMLPHDDHHEAHAH
jgi:F-type H+-transporting ATPase subunit a